MCSRYITAIFHSKQPLLHFSTPYAPTKAQQQKKTKKQQYFGCLKNTSFPARHQCKNKSLRADFDLTNTSINAVSLSRLQQIYS